MRKILAVQHIECENLGILAQYLPKNNVKHNYVIADENEDFPDNVEGYSGLVLLGGPRSINDYYKFFKREEALIKDALLRKIPTLGICLGSQWLAKVLGAKVYKGKQKEIGWYKIKFTNTSGDRIFHDVGNEAIVFQWHGDTFNLPPNCTRLASSELYQNQAFRFRDNVYGLQFHLEVTESMIKEWVNEYKDELNQLKGRIDANMVIKEATKNVKSMSRIAEKFFSGFAKLINDQ